jgi:hypothetical protein
MVAGFTKDCGLSGLGFFSFYLGIVVLLGSRNNKCICLSLIIWITQLSMLHPIIVKVVEFDPHQKFQNLDENWDCQIYKSQHVHIHQ